MALGFRIARANLPKTILIWLIDLLFAASAPLGIIIGIIIIQVVGAETTPVTIVKGTFNAFSAGILIYVGLVHMLSEEMERSELRTGKALRSAMFAGLLLGAAFMAVLAIWA